VATPDFPRAAADDLRCRSMVAAASCCCKLATRRDPPTRAGSRSAERLSPTSLPSRRRSCELREETGIVVTVDDLGAPFLPRSGGVLVAGLSPAPGQGLRRRRRALRGRQPRRTRRLGAAHHRGLSLVDCGGARGGRRYRHIGSARPRAQRDPARSGSLSSTSGSAREPPQGTSHSRGLELRGKWTGIGPCSLAGRHSRARAREAPRHGTITVAVDALCNVRVVSVKVRDAIKLIEADGWQLSRTQGSHRQYRHPSKPGLVTIAGKPSDTLHPKTWSSIIGQAGLNP